MSDEGLIKLLDEVQARIGCEYERNEVNPHNRMLADVRALSAELRKRVAADTPHRLHQAEERLSDTSIPDDSEVEDDYVAWCTYTYNSEGGTKTIVTCDSDAKGAFKVYPASALRSARQSAGVERDALLTVLGKARFLADEGSAREFDDATERVKSIAEVLRAEGGNAKVNQDTETDRASLWARAIEAAAELVTKAVDGKLSRLDELSLVSDIRALASTRESARTIEIQEVLKAAVFALNSYKHGNASPDLADEVIGRIELLMKFFPSPPKVRG